MKRHDTLIDLLSDLRTADRAIRFIDGEDKETLVTFSDLWSRSLRLLGSLQDLGMTAGDELIIFTKSNERFLIAYWAALLGGIVPVPIAVGISDEHRHKLFRIARKLKNPKLFTEPEALERLTAFAADKGIRRAQNLLRDNNVTDADPENGAAGIVAARNPDDIGFIQYSSGSTSEPKGIVLTHRNLTSTVHSMSRRLEFTADDVALSWMPLTHDMGLIGYHLTMLATGMDHAIMDTAVFVRRPLLWMSKTSELRATQIASPNFGYKHYLKAFERKRPTDLDLSHVRLLLNGAEPISVELCEQFISALEPFGFERKAMLPVYGLAEATLGVTFSPLHRDYSHIVAKRHSLKIGEAFESASADDEDAISFVKLGPAIDGCDYRIVDDNDTELANGVVGNIQIRGENVTTGVYRDPESSKAIFCGDWLRTGDCGVTVDGELVVTGRSKDIIIVNGQNYYPHDIEEIIARIHELDLGKVVVCGAKPGHSQTEELLVFVLHRKDVESLAELAGRIRDVVGTRAGLEVDHVIPIPRIPKTTSGKVQRTSLANAYLDGEYDAVIRELSSLAERNQETEGLSGEAGLVAELMAIAAEFSKERKIGPDDNLFEVGISSLTLTEIMLAIDEKLPGQVDVNDLFDYPTIRLLAGFLDDRLSKQSQDS